MKKNSPAAGINTNTHICDKGKKAKQRSFRLLHRWEFGKTFAVKP